MDYIYPKEKKKLLNNYMQNKFMPENKTQYQQTRYIKSKMGSVRTVCHNLEDIDFQSTKTTWEVITFLRKTNIN